MTERDVICAVKPEALTAAGGVSGLRKSLAGGLASLAAAVFMLAVLLPLASCSPGSDRTGCPVLSGDVYGFRLGESREALFKRLGDTYAYKKIKSPKDDDRGEMYEFPVTPDGSRDTAGARLTFYDGCLMEVVVYFEQTTYTKLLQLRELMEERYSAHATSPDGHTEMAFKTYWIKAPGMSVTIRRITKKPSYELYVQFQHDELVERLKESRESGQ